MKIKQNSQLKKFIKEFYFPNPSWKNLPIGFPKGSRDGLNREERHLLEAIVTIWKMENGGYLGSLPFGNLTRLSLNFAFYSILAFSLVSFTYFINVRFNLGISLLTEIFA